MKIQSMNNNFNHDFQHILFFYKNNQQQDISKCKIVFKQYLHFINFLYDIFQHFNMLKFLYFCQLYQIKSKKINNLKLQEIFFFFFFEKKIKKKFFSKYIGKHFYSINYITSLYEKFNSINQIHFYILLIQLSHIKYQQLNIVDALIKFLKYLINHIQTSQLIKYAGYEESAKIKKKKKKKKINLFNDDEDDDDDDDDDDQIKIKSYIQYVYITSNKCDYIYEIYNDKLYKLFQQYTSTPSSSISPRTMTIIQLETFLKQYKLYHIYHINNLINFLLNDELDEIYQIIYAEFLQILLYISYYQYKTYPLHIALYNLLKDFLLLEK